MYLTLTTFERLTLVNQYRILAAVSKGGESESYSLLADDLENGHVYFYRNFPHLQDELSSSVSDFVIETLALYDTLQASFGELEDKAGIEALQVQFDGFDGNNEADHLHFVGALAKRHQFHSVIGEHPKDSHMPMVDVYKRLLDGWRRLGRPTAPLSADQIKAILAERVHPDNR